MKKRYFVILTIFALAFLTISKRAAADEAQPGVGRISLIQGDVSTQRGDSGEWVATTVNAPVTPGDRVSTGARSRTEVQLDYANILRLDQSTEAKIADLTRTRMQIQIAQGLVNFDVLKGSEAEAEIDTPNVAVRPLGEGRYRIEVDSNSTTRITVREGEAEVSTPQGSTRVKKGDLITIEGTDNPQYEIASAPGKDDWDNWNKDRDHVIADAESYRHANRYYTGAGDLDRYGHWEYVPGYDYVWAPYAGPGWVPYSDGSWVWEPYWGWTWVSYEPWGWAPYHYGRWFHWGNSWRWWPGPVYAGYRPVWAPAYVSFFGFGLGGGHWGFSLGFGFGSGYGFGSIGWLPVGPCDPFFPWYGRHGGSYNVVSVTNITNITNIRNAGGIPPLAGPRRPVISNFNSVMNNIHVRQAVTTVPAAQFGRGHVVASHQVVTPGMLKQGQVVAGGLPVVPTRASLSPVNRAVNPAALPARANSNQHFFTRTAPPAGPQPFAEQAAQVQRMIQQQPQPLTAQRGGGATTAAAPTTQQAREPSSLPPGGMAAAGTRAERAARAPEINNETLNRLPESGWRRFGNQPAASNGAQTSARPATGLAAKPQGAPNNAPSESRPGWQRFGGTSQAGAAAAGGRVQAPPAAERTQPRNTGPAQAGRPGLQTFSQGSEARGSASLGQRAPSAPAAREQGGWQRFSSQARPVPSERSSAGVGSRSEPVNPGWSRAPSGAPRASAPTERTFSQPRQETRSPSRFEMPAYYQPQRSYQRPPLEIRKPIVTERAPRSYDSGGSRGGYGGGSRSSAPSGGAGSRGSSSSGSHSGGHSKR